MSAWKSKRLIDIARIGAGNPAPQEKALFQDGRYPFFRTSDVGKIRYGLIQNATDYLNEAGIVGLRRHPKGTILIPKSGASTFLNHRVVMAVDGYVSSHLATILPNESCVDSRYLFHFLTTVKAQDLIQDATYPSLNLEVVAELPVPLPPLLEQQRLAALLDKALDRIALARANTKQNQANIRDFLASELQATFLDQAEPPERVTLNTLLSRGWIEGHLDGNHGSEYPRKHEFVASGVPYVSANCLKDNAVDLSLAKYLSPARAALIRKGVAQDQDVLFAHNATVGPVAVLKTKEPKVILGTSLTYYRCNKLYVLPEYLAYYMRSFAFASQYSAVMRQSTRNQVPITKQREFFHLVPTLAQQALIVKRAETLRPMVSRVEAEGWHRVEELDNLQTALLSAAFNREL